MAKRVAKTEQQMRESPQNVSFSDLRNVCIHYFGEPRQDSTSHSVFKVPWAGDPRVNIQNDHGKAKEYQVKQVVTAIDRLATISTKEEKP